MPDQIDEFLERKASTLAAIPLATPPLIVTHGVTEPAPSQAYIDGMKDLAAERAEEYRADVEARRAERASDRAAIEAYTHGDKTNAVPHFKSARSAIDDTPMFDSRAVQADEYERTRERMWSREPSDPPAAAASGDTGASDAAASNTQQSESPSSRRGRR
jgi:hypothetical protein